MDAKSREQLIWLALWGVVVAVRGWFFFRRRDDLTINRIWLFWGFAALGAFVVPVAAPILVAG